jgi:hypothetical protein
MCIIAIKPAGVKLPKDDTLDTMWLNNDDGAGYMYPAAGKVEIRKGYMTFKSFNKSLKALGKEVDTTATPIVFHFRIGTSGGNTAANTHPFPVTSNITALQKTRSHAPLAVAHNGIIDIKPRKKTISDTMEYVASVVAPLYRLAPDFYREKAGQELLYNTAKSKLAFMDGDGRIETIGKFHTGDDGLIYSNYSYEPYYGYQYWDTWDDYGYRYIYSGGKVKKETKTDTKNLIKLMFLEEEDGYIITPGGDLIEPYDYMIDKAGDLYYFDYETETAYPVDGVTATHSGGGIQYDESRAAFIPVTI